MAFVTLEEVKEFLQIQGTSDDDALTFLLEPSTDIIQKYCERVFLQDSFCDKFSIETDTVDTVLLKQYPVTSVVAVSDDGSAVPSSDYYISSEGRLRLDNGCYFTKGVDTVQVTYVAGYVLTDLPQSLKWACAQIVHDLYNNRFASMASEKIEGYSYKQAASFLRPVVKMILDQFRRVW